MEEIYSEHLNTGPGTGHWYTRNTWEQKILEFGFQIVEPFENWSDFKLSTTRLSYFFQPFENPDQSGIQMFTENGRLKITNFRTWSLSRAFCCRNISSSGFWLSSDWFSNRLPGKTRPVLTFQDCDIELIHHKSNVW